MNGEETAANNSSIYGDAESLRLIHIKLDAGDYFARKVKVEKGREGRTEVRIYVADESNGEPKKGLFNRVRVTEELFQKIRERLPEGSWREN